MAIGDKTNQILDRIREKPESTRWALVVAITLVSSAVLVVFWVRDISHKVAALQAPRDQPGQSGSVFLPNSFSASLANLADTFKALQRGEDPTAVGDELAKKTAEADKPPLEEPSALGYVARGFAEMMRYNLPSISAAMGNLFHGRF